MSWNNYIDFEDKFVGRFSFKERIDFERSCEISGNSVVHNYKFSFRWIDLQCFIGQKFVMLDWFMEIAVIQYDASWWIGLSQGQFITQYQLECGISRKIALHLDAAIDGRVDHVSRWIEENVNFFIDVDKYLVSIVFTDWYWWSRGVDGTRCEEVEVVAYLL